MDCCISNNEIQDFMREFGDDCESQEMLRLLGRHPYTRFNRLALADSLDMKLKDIDRTINRLKAMGLLQTIESKMTSLYALTESEPWHDLIRKTAALDYRQLTILEVRRV